MRALELLREVIRSKVSLVSIGELCGVRDSGRPGVARHYRRELCSSGEVI